MLPSPSCPDDEIIVVDFGLSKFSVKGERMELTCGTVAYVAPEVLSKQGIYIVLLD